MDEQYYFLVIFIALSIVAVYLFIKTYLDKKRIAKYFSEKKYTICKISKEPLLFGIFSRDSDDFYQVVLKSKSGNYILKSCKTDILSGIKEFTTHDKKLCTHCLSVVDTYYTECPSCNCKLAK